MPSRTLRVSPQHRILVRAPVVQRMFDVAEVLLSAKRLLPLPGVSQPHLDHALTYTHLGLAQHDILMADGATVESCLTGPMVTQAMPPITRGLCTHRLSTQPCRMVPNGRRQAALIARLVANGKAVYDTPPGHTPLCPQITDPCPQPWAHGHPSPQNASAAPEPISRV